ncbi:TonB-dependent receptor [Massilia pinisoli]|uniref:TonB-dependent receptor n=1 Tax=Massilia pinisoli TaxID=1772194 RepID=A0ABT1ZVU1_9BURK|nr:TonB-dependent receptor [Massilia pinisoli]
MRFQRTAIAVGAAQFVLMASGAMMAQSAFAQDTAKKDDNGTTTVVVVGQRAALESASARKRNADEIVDSIVADDIGKLPDKSVTEVLQRVVGVTIDRTLNRVDPQQGVGDGVNHYAAEGTGVSVRGLTYVRSELNGRDAFSANGGRSLSFEDVPPELMSGLDVYKNPSAEQIEGGISGLVNLRTALPFDYKGAKGALSVEERRSQLRGKTSPGVSGLLSNRWNTPFGQFGALIDVARSRINTRSDGMQISPYIPRNNAVQGDTSGTVRWIPNGSYWTSNNFERERDGVYGALQWKKDNLSSYLTFFRSKYDMNTTEYGMNTGTANPSTSMLDPGATFADNGALLTGTLRSPQETGLNLSSSSRAAGRKSDTRDIAWHADWRATDQWKVSSDLQHTRATTTGYDNLVGMQGTLPKMTWDLTKSPAELHFDAADRALLLDPKTYYWGTTQEHRDQAVGTLNAARLDAKFTFDSPVLSDLRFGVRFTDRKAETRSTHGSEWTAIAQPWMQGWAINGYPTLDDPRFSKPVVTMGFPNFFGGQMTTPPPVIIADPALNTPNANGAPSGFALIHGYANQLCTSTPCALSWAPAPFGDAEGLNQQRERTKAAYSQLRFNVDTLRYPIDGSVGVRVVRTNMAATGYLLYKQQDISKITGGTVPAFADLSDKRDFDNSYTNVLPSLNVRMKVNDGLQFRGAYSKGMTRPDFYQLQAYTTLTEDIKTSTNTATNVTTLQSITFNGSGRGNPSLKPTTADNLDFTAEYYFGHGGSLTLAVFNKRIKDIVIGQTSIYTMKDLTGTPYNFNVTGPTNGAKGRANGAEIAYQQYFDKLPGLWSGFGISANYTYLDSRLNLNAPPGVAWCTPKDTPLANTARDLAGCDTDGRILGGLPMTNLSKNAYNLAVLYDKGPVSARLAYSWRSKYLQAVNAYGTNGGEGIDANPDSPNFGKGYSVNYALPTYGGAYGELDGSFQYEITPNLKLSVEASNLTNAIYRQYMQQHIGLMERGAFYTGRSYSVRMGYSF